MVNVELKIIAEILKNKNISGKCVTYGVQGIEASWDQLLGIFHSADYNYRHLNEEELEYDHITKYGRTFHQNVFFKMLGFSEVESIDYFPNEKPTHVLNLNEPIPLQLHGQYDMVFDGGTSEHCFDIKEVLFNAAKLVKPGGLVMHINPIAGGLCHGYYNFSPNLFFEFYGQNSFTDMEARILVVEPQLRSYWFDYRPGQFLPESFYGKFALIVFLGEKVKTQKEIIIPVQNYWCKKFSTQTTDRTPVCVGPSKIKSAAKMVFALFPPAYSLCREIWQRARASAKINKQWI